jgi:hypothetical protein
VGPVAGPPGTGKTTFIKALIKIAERLGIKIIFVQAKDCSESWLEVPGADAVIKRISSVLHFTVSDGFRPSFDALRKANCADIQCLIDYAKKRYKPDVSEWIETRLELLSSLFIKGDKIVIPLCLANEDELIRRLLVGILYVLRNRINMPIIMDDMLSFVTNEPYSEAFAAMMRPYMFSVNRNLDSREMLLYNPIIITPGGQGGHYRLAEPHKYVILFDSYRWAIPKKDIEKITRS